MAALKSSVYVAASKPVSDDLPPDENRRTGIQPGQPEPARLRPAEAGAPLAVELRHLRYFVALADAGSFTHAAERMFIAQPTLSQQIRRLEQIVGTPLLQRRRDRAAVPGRSAALRDRKSVV